MTSTLQSRIHALLFDPNEPCVALLPAPEGDEGNRADTVEALASVVPTGAQVFTAAPSVYVDVLRKLIASTRCSQLFLVPPLGSRRDVPERYRSQHPRLGFAELALVEVIRAWRGHEGRVAVFTGARTIERLPTNKDVSVLFPLAPPRAFVYWEPGALQLSGVHPLTMFAAVLLDRTARDRMSRVFRSPSPKSARPDDVVEDFERLLVQQGGSTRWGFVVRDGPEIGRPLLFEAEHPDFQRKVQSLAAFGTVGELGDFVEITRGLHTAAKRETTLDRPADGLVPVLEARSLDSDGSIRLDEIRTWAPFTERYAVAPGDILARSIWRPTSAGSAPVAVVGAAGLLFSQTLLRLRPLPELSVEQRQWLATFLRSDHALTQLSALVGNSIAIDVATLRRLQVPLPDHELLDAMREVGTAAGRLRGWTSEAENLAGNLSFDEIPAVTRRRIVTEGQRLRDRVQLAEQLDDLGFRVRTTYPYPVALRWRKLEGSSTERDGLVPILDCFKAWAAYVALGAVVAARANGVELSTLKAWRDRMDPVLRTNTGDWWAVLEALKGRAFRDVSEDGPLVAFAGLLKDDEVRESVKYLVDLRNDHAHERLPTGGALRTIADEARRHLEIVVDSSDFLAGATLRQVVDTSWDSFAGVVTVRFRDLMGDHSAVPIRERITNDRDLEKDSLYLVDDRGGHHLLRPWVIAQECPDCGQLSTFYLDELRPDTARMKSFEHEHNHEFPELVAPFRAVLGVVDGANA